MHDRSFFLMIPILALMATQTPAAGQPMAAAPAARAATDATANRSQTIDLRPELAHKAWKEGKTTFYADRNIQLVAEVRGGKVVSVTPINLTGRPLNVQKKKGAGGGSRPCIICYNLDQPLASTCIEVPCWMIPILKPILNARQS